MTRGNQQQATQLAALNRSFVTLLSNPNLSSDNAKLGNSLKELTLCVYSMSTSQNLPQGLEARLSTNNVVFSAVRMNKWNIYVAAQIRFLAQDDARKAKSAQTNNQRIKKDLIAEVAPKCEAFFLAASTAIARVTGEAAVLVDNSGTFDSIKSGTTKANNQRQTDKKVDEAIASHKAVVEFEANSDMSRKENQTKLHKLKMAREELSSKRGVKVFDGKPFSQLVEEAIEEHKSMFVPVDPYNTDYGPGLDRQKKLLQASFDKVSLSRDSDDDSISSHSGASGMSIAMKMESTSTKPMTVVSTGTSRKKTCPFASATRMSSSDEDATSSLLLRKKPTFPHEDSSNFNVSTAQSSVAFGDADDSDNEKICYRRSSTSTKNKSILDSDDEAMLDSKLFPKKEKKRARSTTKKRKKVYV